MIRCLLTARLLSDTFVRVNGEMMIMFDSLKLMLFGVLFRIENYAPADMPHLRSEYERMHQSILQHSRRFIDRQHRRALAYWDALAYLYDGATRFNSEGEYGLLLELAVAIESGKLDPKPVLELERHQLVSNARSHLRYYSPRPARVAQHALTRGLLVALLMDSGGKFKPQPGGFYREFELPPTREFDLRKDSDWTRMLVVAVLVQLKADLEILQETGWQRLRRCANRACGAWFVARAMSARQQYCSTYCRVKAHRTSA